MSLSASYTYTDSEQKTGEYAGDPWTQLPKHLFSANPGWQATERVSPWLRFIYRGEESEPVTGPSRGSLIAPSYTPGFSLAVPLKEGWLAR